MPRPAQRCWPFLALVIGLAAAGTWAQEPPLADAPTPPPVERVIFAWEQSVESLRVRDLEGRELDAEVEPLPQEPGRVSLSVPTRGPFVVKGDAVETRRLTSEERQVLPGGLFLPSTDEPAEVIVPPGLGITPLPPRVATWLRLTAVASPIPATWDPLTGTYHTELSFGVHASTEERFAPGQGFEEPIEIRVGLRGLTTREALSPLLIEAPGLANEQSLVLDFLPSTSSPTLEVRSTLSDVNLELEALPRLEVRPESTSMVGLGLARVAVSVEQVAPHGEPLRVTHPTRIALTVDGPATPDPGELQLEPDESAVAFDLRSSGLAPLTVTAVAGGLRGEATIQQRVPWGPILAALFGGALGGFCRRFVKGADKASTPLRLLEGVIVALVAYVAGVLGVGYLALPVVVVATEAGAFLTGALSGFIGVNVLERLQGKASAQSG
ncbi:TIGR04086 family membrane protein [Halomonas sp. BM-2019]|uniref:TIGR04086 family membrane protein n=1 Tax=Halomonas sp. BM-2019 TaxID=2811227 RepID=UPI001B3C284B|nr:MAG: TIGR04086 family membrane protein [Halomonas sp. BM-2019]